MQQKSCLRLVYKISSKQLRKSKWNLTLPLDEAMEKYREVVVSIGSSQVMRWIDEINGISDVDRKVRELQRKIKAEKRKPKSVTTKKIISELYRSLYDIQFQKDYISVVMENNADYDRANKGFYINGIKFRRFLGTNGGIKNSTIVYVNEQLYPELKRRLDNGRNKEVPLVPAKLEAYQALVCSGSTPLPEPKGFIVVPDCITKFKEDVIVIEDNEGGEPILTHEKDYEIEHNDSDGYGFMTPEYSRKVNEFFEGESGKTISGFTCRMSWTKGMIYCFDFVEFAEQVAGSFYITDVWGTKRDVRDADIILTESMLKLWSCYSSWEDYWQNSQENHYEFSATKITPEQLEPTRYMNYQFLQSYHFTDDDIVGLCEPTVNEINDILGMDYRKSIVFFAGMGLNERNVVYADNIAKALMIEPEMIKDPYIRKSIYSMLKKRINDSKKGTIQVDGNFAMISGDPYALAQSMFGMEVTGLLAAGEVYHKYWIDKGAEEIVCFRAPMINAHSIRRMKLKNIDEVHHWYQYLTTVLIYNAWDSACEAMCGADKDGDTNMCTDNPILLRNSQNLETIICPQHKAEKKIVTEEDIISANKIAFNDDIGVITNHATSMFERQAGYDKDSQEYKVLDYRINTSQKFQQDTIDRAKGIIAEPMPRYWYDMRWCDDAEHDNSFNKSIAARYKPYFMKYVYSHLKSSWGEYDRSSRHKLIREFRRYKIKSFDGLRDGKLKIENAEDFIKTFESHAEYGMNPCTVNQICWHLEKALPKASTKMFANNEFDYTIMKSGVTYSATDYDKINTLYQRFQNDVEKLISKKKTQDEDFDINILYQYYQGLCSSVCPNGKELCDIILDLCYGNESSKYFAWAVVGDEICDNLLKKHDCEIHFPVLGGDEFTFSGYGFRMDVLKAGEGFNESSE